VRTALVALLALLALAPAARADDAGVFDAYVAGQPPVDKAGTAYRNAFRRYRRSESARDLRAIIRADRRLNRALAKIVPAVRGEEASSRAGERARNAALTEMRVWIAANRLQIGSLRAALAGRTGRSDRLFRRASRTFEGVIPAGKRAVRGYKAAGFTSPEGPVSDLRFNRS